MEKRCIWVVTADMGYGHRRATDPFSALAGGRIISINSDAVTPEKEQKYWRRILSAYETVSRWKKVPVIGKMMFGILNYLLKIPPADSSADLSKPTFQVKMLGMQIKKGLCGGLTGHLSRHPGALLTSFYAPAIAADMAGERDVFCIICDSDLNRVWVAENPGKSNIIYLSPCKEATQRLQRYGVAKERIFTTGFPLHPELVGTRKLELAEKHFSRRTQKLKLPGNTPLASAENTEPVNIAFAIGGAGAQTELAQKLFDELYHLVYKGLLSFTVIAGTRSDVKSFFEGNKKMMTCKNFRLVWSKDYDNYFREFNRIISATDLLISKPSEISFYAALGIPFIIAPPIGSQEEFNREWLLKNNAGVDLPTSMDGIAGWLLQNLQNGSFIRLAENGFRQIEKSGYYNVLDILAAKNLIEI